MTGTGVWGAPPAHVTLGDDEVHVWRVSLDQPHDRLQQLTAVLSQEERARADRLLRDRSRAAFRAGRGLLRAILAGYVGSSPEALQFRYSQRGKPFLAGPAGAEIQFNLSHSHGLALYAVTHRRSLGVDVEWIRPIPRLDRIAERFFAAGERAELDAVAPGQKLAAFFRCWTRKEACMKASGDGFALPPAQIVTAPAYDRQPGREPGDDPPQDGPWTVRELGPAPGYVGAVTASGPEWALRCWTWPDAAGTG